MWIGHAPAGGALGWARGSRLVDGPASRPNDHRRVLRLVPPGGLGTVRRSAACDAGSIRAWPCSSQWPEVAVGTAEPSGAAVVLNLRSTRWSSGQIPRVKPDAVWAMRSSTAARRLVAAGWRTVASRRPSASWRSTPGAIVGAGPTPPVTACHHCSRGDIDAQMAAKSRSSGPAVRFSETWKPTPTSAMTATPRALARTARMDRADGRRASVPRPAARKARAGQTIAWPAEPQWRRKSSSMTVPTIRVRRERSGPSE
jgi:hypothetical protein